MRTARGQRLAQPWPVLLVPVVFQRAVGFRDFHSCPVAGHRSELDAFRISVPVMVNLSLQKRGVRGQLASQILLEFQTFIATGGHGSQGSRPRGPRHWTGKPWQFSPDGIVVWVGTGPVLPIARFRRNLHGRQAQGPGSYREQASAPAIGPAARRRSETRPGPAYTGIRTRNRRARPKRGRAFVFCAHCTAARVALKSTGKGKRE